MRVMESASLIVLVAIVAVAVIRFRARRYLLVLLTATAVGAWLMGYASGARSTADTLYRFVSGDRVEQARSAVESDLVSPLWGLAFVVLIILIDMVVFGMDVRKKLRGQQGRDSEISRGQPEN